MFIDVHMHKPQIASRSYMDALLAFWPGVQVLKGDLRSAIEMHEMLYIVVKVYKLINSYHSKNDSKTPLMLSFILAP